MLWLLNGTSTMAALVLPLILLAAPLVQLSHAFKPQIRPPINYERFSSRTNNVNVEAPAEKSSMTTLNLIGEVTITSKASPSPNSNGKDLMEFFSLTGSAPLILRGSKNNRIVEIPNPDVSLLEAYHEQCQVVGAQTPKPDDKFFDVTTSGVEFPGLKVGYVITMVTLTRGTKYANFKLTKKHPAIGHVNSNYWSQHFSL